MASEGFTEVDFTCPVCFDFFINPVVLPCSHSICSDCIKAFWKSKGFNECPMCREVSASGDPPLNLALKSLCETFQQERSQRSSSGGENICSAHKEKLKLFCLDDQQPVCLVCRDSKLHTDHSFCPIDEAVNNNKDKLKAILEHLRVKMGIFDNFKQTLDQTADHNKGQTQETEEKINKEFEELREILRNEEVARITVLREEEKQKSQMIKAKTEKTSKQIVSLKCAIRDVEEQMKAEDDSFLQNFKSTLERAQFSLPDPGNVSDLLINTQEYLSDLRLTVIQKIDSSREDPSATLQDLLNHLQEKLTRFEDFKQNLDQTVKHIKAQAECTEKQIKEEFKKLHQLLHDEEAASITALREEEKQKSQRTIDKIENMSKNIVYLTHTIRDTEEQMKAEDYSFLQDLKSTLKRGQYGLLDPENISEMLIDVPKHLSNLKFTVLQKIQEHVEYTPVTLDPNTAHCNLIVSDDLTSVRFSDEAKLLPDNLERFDCRECVLGSEGFDSGIHCWDIEVGDLTNWTFGVMTESAQRKGDILTKKGLWVLGYASGEYYPFITPEQSPPLSVKNKLQKIRVQLNYDKGKLSFIDPLKNTYIHTFTQKFTERVYPWFGVRCGIGPLVILPVN